MTALVRGWQEPDSLGEEGTKKGGSSAGPPAVSPLPSEGLAGQGPHGRPPEIGPEVI